MAVFADPFSVSLHAITRHPPPPSGRALVYGAGSLGSCAVAILTALYPDVEVAVVARFDAQAQLADRLGAAKVLAPEPRLALIEELVAWGGGRLRQPLQGLPMAHPGPIDVVYDTVGKPETFEVGVRVLASRGTLVKAGVHAPGRWEWSPLYFKEISWVGSNAFGVEEVDGVRKHAIDHYLDLVVDGRVDLETRAHPHVPAGAVARRVPRHRRPGAQRRREGRDRPALRGCSLPRERPHLYRFSRRVGANTVARGASYIGILAQVGVDAREVLVDLVGNRHRPTESPCTPDDLGGAFDQRGDVQRLVGSGCDGDQAVVGDQRRGPALQRLDRVVADIGCTRRGVVRTADLAAAVDGELVDAGRNRLVGDGEHGGPHRMDVDHAADVVECPVAREVQEPSPTTGFCRRRPARRRRRRRPPRDRRSSCRRSRPTTG